jgi:hypothetical protein
MNRLYLQRYERYYKQVQQTLARPVGETDQATDLRAAISEPTARTIPEPIVFQ